VTQVFLNYRTADEPFGVALLDRALSDRFGTDTVFLDSKSIPPGEKWEERIFEAVSESAAVLVIMGRAWLSPKLRAHLHDPADFVRREILMAFEHGNRVIPVRLGVPHLTPADLPAELQGLAELQDIEIRFRDQEIDIDRLAAELAEHIPELPAPAEHPELAPSATTDGVINVGTTNSVFSNVHVGGDLGGRDVRKSQRWRQG
jgi:hypothetical protein